MAVSVGDTWEIACMHTCEAKAEPQESHILLERRGEGNGSLVAHCSIRPKLERL